MIPNVHQSIDEIIKSSSAEEKIIWQQLRLLTGENAAIRQYYFCGVITGHEILTYDINRLWFAHSICLSTYQQVLSPTAYNSEFYDQTNNICFYFKNVAAMWDSTAAEEQRLGNNGVIKNIYFSRIALTNYTYFKFIGYRIAY